MHAPFISYSKGDTLVAVEGTRTSREQKTSANKSAVDSRARADATMRERGRPLHHLLVFYKGSEVTAASTHETA